MSFKPTRRPHFFYTTAPLPCPYLPGRTERKVVTELAGIAAETLHDRLSRGGFRRSHNIAYAPVCPSCNACVPIRIRARDFTPNRTQKRIIRLNADLLVQEMPPRATAEQFQLFQRYQQPPPRRWRHGDDEFLRLPRHGRGYADRNLDRRVPPPHRRTGRRLPHRPPRRRAFRRLQFFQHATWTTARSAPTPSSG